MAIEVTWEVFTKEQENYIAKYVELKIKEERKRLANKIRSFTKQLEGRQVNYTENLELLSKIIEKEDS